jgi:hypothetical protein
MKVRKDRNFYFMGILIFNEKSFLMEAPWTGRDTFSKVERIELEHISACGAANVGNKNLDTPSADRA